ncbi:MAG: molybdopterin cofactor-binding domain-containing protein [Chloroflexia bacterium]
MGHSGGHGAEPGLHNVFDPPDFNYPFGSHAAVVEIDERTGHVSLVKYAAVSDVGNPVNPMVVEGQVHGGIAHGFGQAMFEQAVYDDDGHLLTDNLTEYPLPRASQLPNFDIDSTVTPTPHNPLGAKGAGEVGTAVRSRDCERGVRRAPTSGLLTSRCPSRRRRSGERCATLVRRTVRRDRNARSQ